MCGTFFTPPSHSKVRQFGSLSVARPDGGPDIADRVPALDMDQSSMRRISQPDVGRAPWLTRLRRELERALVSRSATEPQDQLLHREMPRIPGLSVDVSLNADHERPADDEGQPLPRIDGDVAAPPKLDPGDDAAPDARLVARVILGQASPDSTLPNVAAGTCQLLGVPPGGLRSKIRAPDSGHAHHMVVGGPLPALTGRRARDQGAVSPDTSTSDPKHAISGTRGPNVETKGR